MVSILGDYYYEFPQPKPLKLRLKDMLEDNVDEKYYYSNKTINMFVKHTEKKQAEGCGFKFEPTDGGGMLNVSQQEHKERTTILLSHQATKIDKETEIANTLMARDYKGFGNQAMNGVIEWKK